MTQDGDSASQGTPKGPHSDLAQALQDLARGEQTAAALENNLANLESKIDQLLASFEGDLAGEAVPTEKEAAADADGKGETGRSGDVEEKKPT